MKNKKGFTLVEVVVSVVLIMVVMLYLLRTIITISSKDNELVTYQEYSVYENNLLQKFYDDVDNKITLNSQLKGINVDSSNQNIIHFVDFNKDLRLNINDNQIIYDNVVYKLPERVKFRQENDKYYYTEYINNIYEETTMIVVNIYVKVYDRDEIIKLMYQGQLAGWTINFHWNNANGSTPETVTSKKLSRGKPMEETFAPSVSNGILALDGWYTSATGGSKYDFPIDVESDMDLYAHWRDADYKIVFNKNNTSAKGSMNTINAAAGKKVVLPESGFTLSNYTHSGWNTATDGTGIAYLRDFGPLTNDQIAQLPVDSSNNRIVTLYAQWLPVEEAQPTNPDKIDEEPNYTPNPSAAKYKVHYKCTQAGCDGSNYQVKIDKGHYVNGTTYDSSSKTLKHGREWEYGKTYKLVVNQFTVDGYDFDGWVDSSGKKYSDEQSVSNLTSTNGATVTLTAQWKKAGYKVCIKINRNGGTLQTDNKNITVAKKTDGTLGSDILVSGEHCVHKLEYKETLGKNGLANYNNTGYINLVRTGYNVESGNEYYSDSNNTKKYYSQADNTNYKSTDFCDSKLEGCTTTLYVNWQQNKYQVHYNGNGNTGQTYNDNNQCSGSACGIKRYAKDSSVTNNGTVFNSTKVWEYNTSSPLIYNRFTKTGYTFNGWKLGNKTYGQQENVKQLTATNNGTVMLYAQWKNNTYQINYNGNGNTGQTYTTTCDSDNKCGMARFAKNSKVENGTFYHTRIYTYDGDAQSLIANAFSKTGYTFDKWKDNSTGKTYTNSQSVKNVTEKANGTVTLTAQWSPITYKVHYKCKQNDCVNAAYPNNYNTEERTFESNKVWTYGVASQLVNNGFKRSGYTFTGWNTKCDGTGTAYDNKEEVKNLTSTNNKTVTLCAQWHKNETTTKKYKVYYKCTQSDCDGSKYATKISAGDYLDGTTYNSSTKQFNHSREWIYGKSYKLVANQFTRPGYTFAGWKVGSTTYSDKQSVSNLTSTNGGTVTLTAQWTPTTYTIKYVYKGDYSSCSPTKDEYNYTTWTDPKKVKFGEKLTTSNNWWKCDTYVFAGWKVGTSDVTWSPKIERELTSNVIQYASGTTLTFTARWYRYAECQNSKCGTNTSTSYINRYYASTGGNYCTYGRPITYNSATWYCIGNGTNCTGGDANGACCKFYHNTYTNKSCRISECGYEKDSNNKEIYY